MTRTTPQQNIALQALPVGAGNISPKQTRCVIVCGKEEHVNFEVGRGLFQVNRTALKMTR
jgi:hypothetical protein